jgi:acyl-coenzyme A synthetase/AMP-(fatty) acid ligase
MCGSVAGSLANEHGPRVFAYLRRYPWLALGTLACAIGGTAMVLVFPAVTKRVIDEVLIQHSPGAERSVFPHPDAARAVVR